MKKLYYDQDANWDLMLDRKVAVIGYGSQGHAHALNLKESGVHVTVGLYKGSKSWAKAESEGLRVASVAEAVAASDVVMMLIPDEKQSAVFREHVAPNLKSGAALAFAHGFNIHFGQVQPAADIDVFMVAPKGPGHLVRRMYVEGTGVPCLLAVHQDSTGLAREIGLAYARGIGGTRAGVLATTFKEETETDLFGEQAILCGGITELISAGFETLVEAGYQPESAYFECMHEMKLIVDLMYEGGIADMNYSVSNNAEYGEYVTGKEVINEESRYAMRNALKRIQNGEYAKMFILEGKTNYPSMTANRRLTAEHQIEKVGAKLRDMMPWIKKNKLVDQSKN